VERFLNNQQEVEDSVDKEEENAEALVLESEEEDIVSELRSERDGYLDQLQRTMAEFANYRKRMDLERINARRIATKDLLSSIVPISDDFHRALAAIPEDKRDEPWVAGVSLIDRNLENLLDREGVTQMEALGKPFDPAVHEAISVVPGSDGTMVVEVYQNGYRHGDTLLRPAIVRVGDALGEVE
jgi:molecular chaperone GrpE